MSNFNLGDSTSFGDGKNVPAGNEGANFWGHNFLKFDGSLLDKEKILKVVKFYVRILTQKDIPVVYSAKGIDSSFTDGKKITISSVIKKDSLDSTIGLGLHEASHIVLTSFKVLNDLLDYKLLDYKYNRHIPTIKNLFNWVEDRRIDYWAYHKAEGLKKYYTELYNRYFFNDEITEILSKKRDNLEETIENYMFYVINSMHPHVKFDELKGLGEIKKIIDIENIERWSDTNDTLKTGVEIFDIILKYVKEDISEKKEDDGGGNKSDNQSGNGGLSGGEKDNKDAIDKLTPKELSEVIKKLLESQENFLDGNPTNEKGQLIKVPMQVHKSKLIESLGLHGNKIETINIDENKSLESQRIDVLVVNKITIHEIKSNLYSIFVKKPKNNLDSLIVKGFSLGTMLGNKLKIRNDEKIIKTIKIKKGRLDKRNLHSAGFGSDKIFYTTKEDKYNDVAIHISVDVSGSMRGSKWENTLVSIIALCKAASTVKGIRVQLSFRYSIQYPVVINFYDSQHDKINKLRLLKYLLPYGGTPEGICFEALRQNIMRPLLNKYTLFVNFSDGEPNSVDGLQITKKVIKKFKASGMSILSYFITDDENISKDAFIDMYGKDSEFIDVQSLINLTKTINNKLLKLGIN